MEQLKTKKSEKKKKCRRQLGGLLPISQPRSRYSALYRDTGPGMARRGAQWHGHDTIEHACDTASRQPRYGLRHYRPTCGNACVHGLARGESRYKNCIVAGGDLLGRDTVRDTAG